MRYSYKHIIVSAVRQHIFPFTIRVLRFKIRFYKTVFARIFKPSAMISNRAYLLFICPVRRSLIRLTQERRNVCLERLSIFPQVLAKELVSRDRRFFGRALHTEFTIITIGYQDSILSSRFGPRGSQGKYHELTDDIIKPVNIRETIIRDNTIFWSLPYIQYTEAIATVQKKNSRQRSAR